MLLTRLIAVWLCSSGEVSRDRGAWLERDILCGPKLPVCHSQRLKDAETPRRNPPGHIRRENTHIEVQRIYRLSVMALCAKCQN